MARGPFLTFLLRPRPFLIFGTQTPPRFIFNTLTAAAFFHLFVENFYTIKPLTGASMLPTFNILDDVILQSRLHRRGRGCEVGDIVSYTQPERPEDIVVKRIIGMPGDFVCVNPDPEDVRNRGKMLQVPEGHCWMGGDNIPESIDSKVYGPVPLALIRGKILARVFWPPKWFKSPFVRVEFDDEPEE